MEWVWVAAGTTGAGMEDGPEPWFAAASPGDFTWIFHKFSWMERLIKAEGMKGGGCLRLRVSTFKNIFLDAKLP